MALIGTVLALAGAIAARLKPEPDRRDRAIDELKDQVAALRRELETLRLSLDAMTLDRHAAERAQLQNAYAFRNCAPSRAQMFAAQQQQAVLCSVLGSVLGSTGGGMLGAVSRLNRQN